MNDVCVYDDKISTVKELLEKDNSVSIHYRNVQALAIEMYKVANGISPEIMNEIFQLREKSHYNLRYTSEFIIPPIHSVYHGSESVSYLGPKIWELIPPVIRQIDTFSGFKKAIKKWKPTNCPCRICKTYIPKVGFIQKQYYNLPCMCHFNVFIAFNVGRSGGSFMLLQICSF